MTSDYIHIHIHIYREREREEREREKRERERERERYILTYLHTYTQREIRYRADTTKKNIPAEFAPQKKGEFRKMKRRKKRSL